MSKSIGLKYRVLVVYRVFEIEPNFLELKKPCKIGDQINTGVGKKSKKKNRIYLVTESYYILFDRLGV